MNTHQSQLNSINRTVRILIGMGFIGAVMATSGSLGYLTLLPLLAVYPLITGLVGEDPIDGLVTNWLGGYQDHCFRPSSRVALLAVGVGAIGVVMANPQSLASFGWIALASVYPIMAGLFGEDLFSVMLRRQGQVMMHRPVESQPVVSIKHREATVHHHGLGPGQGTDHKAA